MPNDPRVKFRKKVYDPSRNIYYDYEPRTGGGGGSPYPGGGGGGGGGDDPPGPGPGPDPEPDVNPGINPGQIAGIALGSIAAAAALAYAAKKAADEIKARRSVRFQPLVETELTDVNAPRPVPKPATQKAPKPSILKTPNAATTKPTPTPKADKSRVIKPDTASSNYNPALFQEIQLQEFGRAGFLGPTGPVGIDLPVSLTPQQLIDMYGDQPLTGQNRSPSFTPNEEIALNDQIEQVTKEIKALKGFLADETLPQVKRALRQQIKILEEKNKALAAPIEKAAFRKMAIDLQRKLPQEIKPHKIPRALDTQPTLLDRASGLFSRNILQQQNRPIQASIDASEYGIELEDESDMTIRESLELDAKLARSKESTPPIEIDTRGGGPTLPQQPTQGKSITDRIQELESINEDMEAIQGLRETPPPPPEGYVGVYDPAQELNEHLKHLEDFHRSVVEGYTKEGRTLPEASQSSLGEWQTKTDVVKQVLSDPVNANKTITDTETGKEISMTEALDDLVARSDRIKRLTKKLGKSADSELNSVAKTLAEIKATNKSSFGTRKGPKPNQKRTLTTKTGLLATGRATAQSSRGQTSTPVEQQSLLGSSELEAVQMETALRESVISAQQSRPIQSSEVAGTSGTATRSTPKGKGRIQDLPKELAAPSPLPSPPESGTSTPAERPSTQSSEQIQTPRERPVMEQTPAERAAFAEELSTQLSKKGRPPKPKAAKTTFGTDIQATRPVMNNYVSSKFTNVQSARVASELTGLQSRLPTLVRPSINTIKSIAGHPITQTAGAIGIGIGVSYLMAEYFKAHPATDKYSALGQQFAIGFSGAAAGNLFQRSLQIAGRIGTKAFTTRGGALLAGREAIAATGEAAAMVAIQMGLEIGIETLMDKYHFSHLASKTTAATVSAASGVVMGAAMGNIPGAIFMTAMGAWQIAEAVMEGMEEDANSLANARMTARVTAQINNARTELVKAMARSNYDYDLAYSKLKPQTQKDLAALGTEQEMKFRYSLAIEFDPATKERYGNIYNTAPPEPSELDKTLDALFVPVASTIANVIVPGSGFALLAYDEYMNVRDAQEAKDKETYYQAYVAYLLQKEQYPYDYFEEPKGPGFELLERDTLGSWRSSAQYSATFSYKQSLRYTKVISDAREKVINEWKTNMKTIDELTDEQLVYTAKIGDDKFEDAYEAYIISDANVRLISIFNDHGTNYRDADQKLVSIAARNSGTLEALDHYYEVMTSLSRDTGLSVAEIARLNALPEVEQKRELTKINVLREQIILKGGFKDKGEADQYNASLLRQLSSYGDNIEDIMRNLNDFEMLEGHSYLYATNRSDLYRQLHLEAPKIELPSTDYADLIGFDYSKNRTPGDTDRYGYGYYLVDKQFEELQKWLAAGGDPNETTAEHAKMIYERDYKNYFKTDEEVAADFGMTLTDFQARYGTNTAPNPDWSTARPLTPEEYQALGIDTGRPYVPPMPPTDAEYEAQGLMLRQGTFLSEDGLTSTTYKDGIATNVVYRPPLITKNNPTVEELNKSGPYRANIEDFKRQNINPDGTSPFRTDEDRAFLEQQRLEKEKADADAAAGIAPVRPVEMTPEQIEEYRNRGTFLKQGTFISEDGLTSTTYKNGIVTNVEYSPPLIAKSHPTVEQLNKNGPQRATEEDLQDQNISPDGTRPYRPPEERAPTKVAPEPPQEEVARTPAIPSAQPLAPQKTASALNLAVAPSAPARAPATTFMPEDTTPGIANP